MDGELYRARNPNSPKTLSLDATNTNKCMDLRLLDYFLIFGFFALILFIGIFVSKKSGKNTSEYFLSGRNMPWWLLGFSMVATTFSTDTPNLVTDFVRTDGVSGNWGWWVFLLTGLLTVFVYAKLWRKSDVRTDMEFYELRYGGRPATFLRGFRALYLGVIFNVMAMAGVTLAAIKIGQVMLGLSPAETVLIAGGTTVIFSTIGGFRGVVYTDFVLFFVAMAGSIGATIHLVNLPEVGGLRSLLQNGLVQNKMSLLPDHSNNEVLVTILIVPLAVQWWSSWYPGGEPGGGGYVAQRMLAAKNGNHAVGATFFFNILHYALRPWPWILVALASLVVFPDLESIKEAFPNIKESKLGHDIAYSAMLTKLPSGLLGLVLASLGAAYMSTISTHLNWGSSYVVNDFYKQQINKSASEKELVNVGRVATAVLMVLSALLALALTNAVQLFDIIIMFGAGTGLIFILRWFWWRINAWSEISAMFASGIISMVFNFSGLGTILFGSGELTGFFPSWSKFPMVVLVTSIIWLSVMYLTPPESVEVLVRFYKKTAPGGPGWARVREFLQKKSSEIDLDKKWPVPHGIVAMVLGCVVVYGCLFATGNWIYGNYKLAMWLTVMVLVSAIALYVVWGKIRTHVV